MFSVKFISLSVYIYFFGFLKNNQQYSRYLKRDKRYFQQQIILFLNILKFQNYGKRNSDIKTLILS